MPYQPAFLVSTARCCDGQAGASLEYERVGAEHYCHRIKYSTSKIVGPITFFLKNVDAKSPIAHTLTRPLTLRTFLHDSVVKRNAHHMMNRAFDR